MNIETNRLILTSWQDTDEQSLYALNSDAQAMQYFLHSLSKTQNQQFFAQLRLRFVQQGYGLYKVTLKNTHQFIGFVGLNHPHYDLPFICPVEISWRLLPMFWHQGLAFEAAQAVLQYGFDQLKFSQIMAFTAKCNRPSWTLMQRLGMQFQQEFQHPLVDIQHRLASHVLYSMQSSDFRHVKLEKI
ncbi:GNAT family N-acetyltransferase [Acinetobacter qingfengensis]|uniref:N-acetyltransferase domain-containing protein n=1 Tax=Acinetobacter qingfengensis TaxID=1262585 RepID=A0A1E7RFQ2_9GAMM|nr:GNAT family N-acetyltransferase [Acinetobacter qingfengensis]KAA8732761.1 GNAT family N-acetyltransferase [Acinetobacter qingfengensis]OEY98126.1 hypothetical protein BJI46_00975 [Acinetobacter qingfengensis]